MKKASFSVPKLAILVALLIATIAPSYGESTTSITSGGMPTKIIILEELVMEKPEMEVVKPNIIEGVTAGEQVLQCKEKNEYCSYLVPGLCCHGYVCLQIPVLGGVCI